MANYTKGPWHYYPWLSQFRIDVKGLKAPLEPVCYNIPKEANAQLIAAAPELYEALKTLTSYPYEEEGASSMGFGRARRALAKAEGRE